MKIALTAALIFSVASGVALAQTPPIANPDLAPPLNACEQARLDWTTTPKPKLTRLSTPREFITAGSVYARGSWLRADRDCNGAYSFEEWRDQQWEGTLKYDYDGDGRLSKTEYQSKKCVVPIERVFPNPNDERFKQSCYRKFGIEFTTMTFMRGGYLTREVEKDNAMGWFRENDRNRDGKVTRAEMDAAANAVLTR